MSSGGNFQDFFTRPDRWLREHRDEAKIAALVAAAVAAPYAAGAFGAAGAGAAGAGVGAAEAGAAGAGLTAAEYAALTGIEGGSSVGFAAGAGGAGAGALEGGLLGAGTGAGEYFAADAAGTGALEGGLLGAGTGAGEYFPAAASAMDIGAAAPYGGELSSVGDIGGTMLGGAPPQNVTVLPGNWSRPLDALERVKAAMGSGKGIKALNAAQQFSKLAQPQPVAHMTVPRPSTYQNSGQELAAMQALLSNPASAERLKYLLRARGISV